MESVYFKRFRMDADLQEAQNLPVLPPGYRFVAWSEGLLDVHARTKYRAFCNELDAIVFPCLGNLEGCRRLMREIRAKAGFLPDATWPGGVPPRICSGVARFKRLLIGRASVLFKISALFPVIAASSWAPASSSRPWPVFSGRAAGRHPLR